MTTRSFPLISVLAVLALGSSAVSAQTYQPNWASLDTRPIPAWFTDAKFGIFIHWGVYSVPAYAPVLPGKLAYAEWYWHAHHGRAEAERRPRAMRAHGSITRKSTAPTSLTRISRLQFNAELFDPDHWADVFQRSGARYVALTSKHHEGFALWPSQEASKTWGRPWNAVEIGPHRDLLGDLTTAVRAQGSEDGHLLFALRVVQPALSHRQATLCYAST